ncbi:hypothetical protein BV25DRAFT_1801624, partial [Artomyces pyxidatus]
DTAFALTEETLLRMVKVNVIGPALTAQAYLPYLEKGKRKVVVNVSSGLGSIASNHGGQITSYCLGKTAPKAAERPDLITLVINPGWVRMDIGGPNAPLSTKDSVYGLLKVVIPATKDQSGRFFSHNRDIIPW